MKINNWIKNIAVFVAMLFAFASFPVSVFAATNTTVYNVESAVDYANKNWDNEEAGVCDQFVKACLAAGNVEILAGGVNPVKDALIDGGFGILINNIKLDGIYAKASSNPDISIGDPLLVYCNDCERYTHIVLITGIDEDGNFTVHGRNPAQENFAKLGTYRHTEKHTDCRLNAIHIKTNTFHKHSFEEKYVEEHPHRMYVKCSGCDVQYFLGAEDGSDFTYTIPWCPSCNKPIKDIPVFKRFEETSTSWSMEWSTVEGAVGYQVWRAKSLDGTYWPIMSTDSEGNSNPKMQVTFSNSKSSMAEGTTYFYKVEAVLENGASVYSDIKDTAGNTYPIESEEEDPVEVPTVIVTLNASDKPVIEWAKVDGAAKYEVQYSTTGESSSFTKLINTTASSVTHSSSKAGTTYYYRVRAVASNGTTSEYSNVVSITVPKVETISAPTMNVTLNTSDKPAISWNKVDGAAKYELQYSTTGEESSFAKLINTTALSVTHSSSKAGTTYYYRVRAVDSNGTTSEYSSVVSITVPKVETISAPTISVALNTSDKPVISWNKVDGAAKYELQYSTTGESSSFTKLINTTSNKITHSSSKAGTTYYYRVRAVASSGTASEYSNVVSVTVPKAETAKVPEMTGSLNTAGKPYLKWTGVEGATRYDVYRSTSGKVGTFTRLIKSTGFALTNTSAKEGTTYYYKVRAVYANGTVSEFSNLVELTTPKAEVSATIPVLTGTLKNGKPYLTWTAVDNAVRYDVYRSTSGKVGTFNRLIKSTGYALTNSSANPGTVYYYKVRAVYANGTVSEFSNLVNLEATK